MARNRAGGSQSPLHLVFIFGEQSRARLTKTHSFAATDLDLAHDEHEHRDDQNQRQPVDQKRLQQTVRLLALDIGDDTDFFQIVVHGIAGITRNHEVPPAELFFKLRLHGS